MASITATIRHYAVLVAFATDTVRSTNGLVIIGMPTLTCSRVDAYVNGDGSTGLFERIGYKGLSLGLTR